MLTVWEMSQITAQNAMIAAILPEISVNISGMYTPEDVAAFADVKISPDVPAGYALIWNAFVRDNSGSDAADDYAVFYDSDGSEINTVPENHIVKVSAYLAARKTYAPVISAVMSGDVEPIGSYGGGCNLGVSVLGLIICALIFRKSSH